MTTAILAIGFGVLLALLCASLILIEERLVVIEKRLQELQGDHDAEELR